MATQKRRKTAVLHVRLRPEEKAEIAALAEARGVSLSELVHATLLEPEPRAPAAKPRTPAHSEA